MNREAVFQTLINTLESLTGEGNRHLDEEIATAVWGEPRPSGNVGDVHTLLWWHHGLGRSVAPRFTTSLDDSVPGERIRCVSQMGDGRWEAEAMSADGDYYKAEANTEALARRAAALRATIIR